MNNSITEKYTAFAGHHQVASGDLKTVTAGAHAALDKSSQASLLIFDNATSRQVEIDLRGTLDEVLGRLPVPVETTEAPIEDVKVGRPKLGVVAREVTLLPRHWDWLATQTGGASVTLRKLVEEARRGSQARDEAKAAQEAIDRFMMVMAGNFPGCEEASRALYRGERDRFEAIIANWPEDVAAHLRMLAEKAPWDTV